MSSVICPYCATHVVNEPVFLTEYCYAVVGRLSIVTCIVCNQHFVVKDEKAVWPVSVPPAPFDIPEKVKEAYEDARRAHAVGANIGALMAARTALIRFLRDMEASKFQDLVDRRIITPAIYGAVDQLRLWADVAGHGDIEVNTLDSQEVGDILDYLATALEAAYTHQARVDKFVSRTKDLKSMEKEGPKSKA